MCSERSSWVSGASPKWIFTLHMNSAPCGPAAPNNRALTLVNTELCVCFKGVCLNNLQHFSSTHNMPIKPAYCDQIPAGSSTIRVCMCVCAQLLIDSLNRWRHPGSANGWLITKLATKTVFHTGNRWIITGDVQRCIGSCCCTAAPVGTASWSRISHAASLMMPWKTVLTSVISVRTDQR